MYERHHAELYRAAMRASRDAETAEDLVQEAFLRLVLEIDRNRTPDNARAWLHRVIANLAVSLGRKATLGRKFADALVSHEEPPSPEAVVIDVELRTELAAALRALPDEARTALVLAASGFSGAEVAAAIGRSDCATRALMCRARLKLRDRLVAGAIEPPAIGPRAPAPAMRAPGMSAPVPAERVVRPVGLAPSASGLAAPSAPFARTSPTELELLAPFTVAMAAPMTAGAVPSLA